MNQAMLHDILERLDRYRQAATCGAVAGVVGASHRTVMAAEPRSPRKNWVLNKRTRLPAGDDVPQYNPDLFAAIDANGVIDTPEDLDEWLASHP